MKRKVLCVLCALLMLCLCACAAEPALSDVPPAEEMPAAISADLVNVFGTPSDAALAELGLADAPFDEDAGGMIAEYTWCGEPMETVINPDWLNTGEVVSVRARTECADDAEMPEKLQRYVEIFSGQFGDPINYSTEIANEEERTGHTYAAAALEDILAEFAGTEKDCALTFRFALPDRGEDVLEFAECAFYKDGTGGPVTVSLHMLRLSELDYTVVD